MDLRVVKIFVSSPNDVAPERWRSLCRKSLDWVEIVRGGPAAPGDGLAR